MSSTANDLPKWDVFLSFRGLDTRRNFISFLYKELVGRSIQTFKDDKELENGQEISPELKHAIEVSKFAVVVVSVNYAESSWCLTELVSIMELENKKSITVIPVFYGVDPSQVRRQIGEVGEQFKKHESREDPDRVLSWRQALTKLASLSGNCSSQSQDDSDLVDKIADKISQTLDTTGSNGNDLEGIDKHMKALNRLMELNSHKNVKIVGIWGRGCEGRSALAKFVYQKIHQEFERHCFLGSVKMISHGRHLSHLKEEFQRRIQGQHARKLSLRCQKVLLVADDVNKMEQIDALASEYYSFGRGSVVIITSHDKQLLLSSGIKDVYEAECLTFQKRCELFRQLAFKQTDIYAAFEAFFRPSGAVDLYGSFHAIFWLFIYLFKYIHKIYTKYVVLARGKHFECIRT